MTTSNAVRIDWVDYAKGICIVLVVMMHSTLGVEAARGREGWLHDVVEFAKPFRMPDFFLISGLFLARVIDRDWRTYLDRKVVHFALFLPDLADHPVRGQIAGDHGRPADWRRSAAPICWHCSSRSARCGSFICCRSSSW